MASSQRTRALELLLAAGIVGVPSFALAQNAAPRPPAPAAAAPEPSTSTASRPPPDLPPPPPPPWQPGAMPAAGDPPTVAEPRPMPRETPPTASPSNDAAVLAAMARRIDDLEHRLAETRREVAEHDKPALDREDAEKLAWLRRFKVSGYVQPQLLLQWFDAAGSPNIGKNGQLPIGIDANATTAKADGTSTNGDFFRLRRARLKTEFTPTEGTRFVFEIDPTPAGGPSGGIGTVARTVEAVGIVHWPSNVGTTEFAAGIFKVPFGFEVLQSDADRPFIERSWIEQNLFPGEFDTGLRAYSSFLANKLTVKAAVVNGQVQAEKTFAVLPDLNKGKDVVGRVAYDLGFLTVGASGYYGQGQIVDTTLLRLKQFPRWAGNLEVDAKYTFAPSLGESRLFAEATLAQNLDRGVRYGALALPGFPADIVNGSVNDLDELGYWVRVEQDLGKHFTLAARYDFYTPNSAQGNDGRDTFGAVGVIHFTRALQWMVEFDHATDNVHKPGDPAPSKHIETLSNVLQARF